MCFARSKVFYAATVGVLLNGVIFLEGAVQGQSNKPSPRIQYTLWNDTGTTVQFQTGLPPGPMRSLRSNQRRTYTLVGLPYKHRIRVLNGGAHPYFRLSDGDHRFYMRTPSPGVRRVALEVNYRRK